ncbi:MAG: FCD domain-containing protein [Kordiimonadaceae bacterium]|nr:FCD domain-containing protein [Kordiimonadaceae bacterium]
MSKSFKKLETRTRTVTPVRVPKTAEIIAGRLRAQIAHGELKDGDALLGEADLLKQFMVSRPTIREAIRILESEGLIEVSRGAKGGARVRLPDGSIVARHAGLFLQVNGVTLADIYEARTIIEPPAVRVLTEKGLASDVEQLRECIELERQESEETSDFSNLPARFHRLLVELSGNKTLNLLVIMLNDIVESQYQSAVSDVPGKRNLIRAKRRSIRSYEKLVELIADGKGEEAEKFWQKHMEVVGKIILKDGGKAVVDLFVR